MSQSITLTSGTIFNGNPITLAVIPDTISETDKDGNPIPVAFHRVILEVNCGLGTTPTETIKLSAPVLSEPSGAINVDISSALRTFKDSYEYKPDVVTFPLVCFNVQAYDEYMTNGIVHRSSTIAIYPSSGNLRTIFGAFSDMDRFTSSKVVKDVTGLTRKPKTPQLVVVGEALVYAVPYSSPQNLTASRSLAAPKSKILNIVSTGSATVSDLSYFALPAEEAINRKTFRFINAFGVMESINVPLAHTKKFSAKSETYAATRQETFTQFSRSVIRKQNNRETWAFISDPLTEEWLYWYLHEFLMSEHVWMQVTVPGTSTVKWLPVTITPEDNITMYDRTKPDSYTVSFSVQLDINGSPLL